MRLNLSGTPMYAHFLFISVAVCAVSFAAGSSSVLQAQQNSVLTGSVLDPRGSNLPGAVVEVKNEVTGALTTAKADAQGRFATPALSAGKYDVQVTVSGFAPAVQKAVVLDGSQPQDVAIKMNLADAADEVTVEAVASGDLYGHGRAFEPVCRGNSGEHRGVWAAVPG